MIENNKKKHLELSFDGYYFNLSAIPNEPGVYCIYKAKYEDNGVKANLKELLYIGEAEDMRERLSNGHETLAQIIKDLRTLEQPCFSFAKTKEHELAEAALIYRTKPPYNEKNVEGYHKEPVIIEVDGDHYGIASEIILDEDDIS